MSESPPQPLRSLDQQRAEYASRRGLAMPLAGLIVWTLIGVAGGLLVPDLGCVVAVHRYWLYRISWHDALAFHRRRLPGQEKADERLRQPIPPLRRDGPTCVRHRHSVLPRRLYVIAVDCGDPGRSESSGDEG